MSEIPLFNRLLACIRYVGAAPECCSVLQCVAVCCSVLQCVAVCCSVLQCAAVCCSVLQTLYIIHVRHAAFMRLAVCAV